MAKREREPKRAAEKKTAPGPQAPREEIVALLAELGRPVPPRDLLKRLGGDARRRAEAKEVLRALVETGEVVQIRGQRVGLPTHMNLMVGRLQCSPSGYGFVVPESRKPDEKDLYVAAANMKEALHGDRVVARKEKSGPKGPEGRVIRVLERALQRLVGRFEQDGRFGGYVVPFDRRVLHELFIAPGDEGGALSGQMVAAELLRPPTATRNPVGRVVKVLGRLEEKGVDLRVVMAKYELPEQFPAEVEEEAARAPQEVRPQDTAGRTDFRGTLVITVDPATARDHDDAISLERHGEGWRLGVHIADVAHYVRRGTLLDQEAYQRGTSVYFPETVVPMLPHALSSHICSLVEGKDRLAQSVLIDLDAKGRVQKAEFHDSVIRSAAKLSYQEAQAIVDGDAALALRFPAVVQLVRDMDTLAAQMRKRRYERGSIDFDVPEPQVTLGPGGEIESILASERLDSMRAIEEFMLAANEAVAARLHAAAAGALFRIHEPPDGEKVEEFLELVKTFGHRIPGDPSEVAPQDFQRILRQVAGKPEERLVSYLLLRTMKLARYHEENLGHFGLATTDYAHFTSPIRRYPDLVVHRALRALRKRQDPEKEVGPRALLPEMGLHLSEKERKAAEAERELLEWKKVRFMAERLGEVFPGTITGVQSFGLFVELDAIYVQGMVHVSTMSDDYYLFNEKTHSLRGENTAKAYRLGDRVEVQVVRADLDRRQVDFALAGMVARPGSRAREARPGDGRPARKAAGEGRGSRRGRPKSGTIR